MKISFGIILFFFGMSVSILGQNQIEIEGKILDKETKEPIPFANIYNKNLGKGTIINSDGYFRILINEATDTVTISFIGYKEQTIKIKADKKNYLIYLDENILFLNEVTVKPKDNSYLFELSNHTLLQYLDFICDLRKPGYSQYSIFLPAKVLLFVQIPSEYPGVNELKVFQTYPQQYSSDFP